MLNITKITSTAKTTAYSGRKIQYIVIHYTAGVSSKPGSAANTAKYFATTDRDASADFVVDDATVVQYNPDIKNRYCWAVGGAKNNTKGGRLYGIAKNTNCISIEICSTNSTGKMQNANSPTYSFTDAALKNALELTQYLMAEYGIDADHVIRHYDVNGKLCPGIIGWNAESGNESKWAAFKAKLSPSKGNMTYVGKGIGSATAREQMEVRKAAKVSSASLGHVDPGKKVEVLQILASGWLKIVWPGSPNGYGYTSNVGGKYYSMDVGPSKVPKWVGEVNTGLLNVRSEPKVSNPPGANVITQLGYKNMVDVCDQSGSWYYIRFKWNGRQNFGYVAANYITKA
jgi:N-acetylmuramoyl-L-alanine amidase CwlA